MNKKFNTKLNHSAFHVAVRNPVYYGRIFIEKYKNEDSELAIAKHLPLITKSLLYKIQDILDEYKRVSRPNTKFEVNEKLFLRGFLTCPICQKNLTGSGSKGRTNLYYYYHCQPSCGFRKNADLANEKFDIAMQQFKLNKAAKEIVKKTILKTIANQMNAPKNEKNKILSEIDEFNNRLSVARRKLIDGVLDDDDYSEIKNECKQNIERLEKKLKVHKEDVRNNSIEKSLDKAISFIENIPTLYAKGEVSTKRQLIGSIFPQKLEYDENQYRTTRINEIARCIFDINNEL